MIHLAFVTGIAAAATALLIPSGRNLEYEHVTFAAAIVSVCWPLVALHRSHRIGSPTQWLLTVAALFSGLALPGLVMFALKICPCSEIGYGQWLMVQALPSCIFSATAGHMTILASRYFETKAGIQAHQKLTSRLDWRTSLLWLTIVAALLTTLAVMLWFMPQKRAVHILLGFLHGPIYDERIWLHRDIILARTGHAFLFAATGLAACTWKKSTKRYPDIARRTVIGSLASGWVIITIMIWGSPVTGHGSQLLQGQFSGRIEGAGFKLFHDMDHQDASRLAEEAEFHIRDLKKIFGPIEYPTIYIYAYPDAHSKKLWFGGGATDVTDVVTPGVHITAGGRRRASHELSYASQAHQFPLPHPTLRHELVHALMSRIAFHGLGFHPNMAITEGLAVAFAPDANIFSVMSLDESAAELLSSGRIKNPESLFSPWTFWLESGPRAYTVAGSLIGWLAKSPRFNGIKTVTELYAGKNWKEATGANAGNLIAEWQQEIAQNSSNAKNDLRKKIRASTIFRSSGIALNSCPHSFADRMAANPDAHELERMGEITGDPTYHLMVIRRKAHDTFIAKDRTAAATLGEEIINEMDHPRDGEPTWPPRNEEDIEMRILALDLMAFGESKIQTSPDLADLASFHDSHPLPIHLARQILIRDRLGQILPPEAAAPWRWYLAGWSALPTAPGDGKESPEDEPWVLEYLRLKNRLRSPSPKEVSLQVPVFMNKKIDEVLTKREPAFAFEWYRSLAELAEKEAPAGVNLVAQALWLKAAATNVIGLGNNTVRDQMEQNARRTGGGSVP